jgi:RNA polymerase sigma factor (TIGR02999 family)
LPPLSQQEATTILSTFSSDERPHAAELLPAVFSELYGLAEHFLRGQRPDHTLQPTALVHEAYLRLAKGNQEWTDKNHFFRVAAAAMRHILVNHARDRSRQKRGGGRQRVPLDDVVDVLEGQSEDLVALDEALLRLAATDARQARVVELRFFGGLTVDETAEVLGVSARTVKGDWQVAKLWLLRELS